MKTMSWRLLTIGLLWLTVLCGGCSSGGGGSATNAPPPPSSYTVSGTVSKGLVNGGAVSIFAIDATGLKVTPALASDVTDAAGHYSIALTHSGPILVEVTGGTYTDEATGIATPLAGVLRAALPAADGSVTVAVTPLTELAVRIAEKYDFTPEKITEANALLSQLIGASITEIQPANPANAQAFGAADADAKNYALMLAAISRMAADQSGVDVLAALAADLDDMRLDKTGADLTKALTDFLADTEYNNTGETTAGTLGTILNGIVTGGFTPTGGLSLAEAKRQLSLFLTSASADDESVDDEKNYLDFITYMTTLVDANTLSTNEKREAYLFHALANLMYIYKQQAFGTLKDLTGLSLNSTQAELDKYNNDLLAYDPAKVTALINFAADPAKHYLVSEFAELEVALDAVLNDLAEAKDVNTSISLADMDTAYFDNIDVQALTMIVQGLKAGCIYMQTLDLTTIANWNVTPTPTVGIMGVGSVDIRTLMVANDGVGVTDAQTAEFLTSNPSFLSYADKTKLASFRATVTAVRDQLQTVFAALDALGEAGRSLRYRNAFGVDSAKGLQETKESLEVLNSLVAALDNPGAYIITSDNELTSRTIIKAADGFSYWQYAYDFYEESSAPNDAITLKGLADGTDSLNDLLIEDARPDFELYLDVVGSRHKVASGIIDTDWENPIDSYTIPQATITIDGNGADWAAVPVFMTNDTVQVKIAGSGDNLFVYMSDSGPAGLHDSSATNDSDMIVSYIGTWSHSVRVELSAQGTSIYLQGYGIDSNQIPSANKASIVNGTITNAMEMQFSGLSQLIASDQTNTVGIYVDRTHAGVSSQVSYYKQVKLYLP